MEDKTKRSRARLSFGLQTGSGVKLRRFYFTATRRRRANDRKIALGNLREIELCADKQERNKSEPRDQILPRSSLGARPHIMMAAAINQLADRPARRSPISIGRRWRGPEILSMAT